VELRPQDHHHHHIKVPSIKIGGGVSAGTKTSGSSSTKASGSTGGKIHIKINLKSTKKEKTLPSQWNLNTNCRTSFVAAWNAANQIASMRVAINTAAKSCMKSMFALKSQMICASCDPALGSKLSSTFSVNSKTTKDFEENCAVYLSTFADYDHLVTKVVTYAYTVKPSTAGADALAALKVMNDSVALQDMVSKCFPSATKSTTKRILQAVVPKGDAVTQDNWTWWKTANVKMTRTATDSADCLASSGIANMAKEYIFETKFEDFTLFAPYLKALDAAYAAVGNATAVKLWAGFKGQAKKPVAPVKPVKPVTPVKPTKPASKIIVNGFLPGLDTLNVMASLIGKKGAAKKSVRRLQAVVAAKAELTNSATGVDLSATGQDTGLSALSTEFEGNGSAELSGNLLKVFSTLALTLLVFLN